MAETEFIQVTLQVSRINRTPVYGCQPLLEFLEYGVRLLQLARSRLGQRKGILERAVPDRRAEISQYR